MKSVLETTKRPEKNYFNKQYIKSDWNKLFILHIVGLKNQTSNEIVNSVIRKSYKYVLGRR